MDALECKGMVLQSNDSLQAQIPVVHFQDQSSAKAMIICRVKANMQPPSKH